MDIFIFKNNLFSTLFEILKLKENFSSYYFEISTSLRTKLCITILASIATASPLQRDIVENGTQLRRNEKRVAPKNFN